MKTVLVGMGVSALITLIFFGIAKLLVVPVAGRNAEQYRQERDLPPPTGEWFVENANMWADAIIPDWLLLFAVFWGMYGLFGKGKNFPSIIALSLVGLAILLNFYFVLNAIFDWYYWSCFEEPHTHTGFDFGLIFECPSRGLLLSSLPWTQLALVVIAGLVAVYHSRRRAPGGAIHA